MFFGNLIIIFLLVDCFNGRLIALAFKDAYMNMIPFVFDKLYVRTAVGRVGYRFGRAAQINGVGPVRTAGSAVVAGVFGMSASAYPAGGKTLPARGYLRITDRVNCYRRAGNFFLQAINQLI